jgi:Dolichyl-phosphate-mannose-protein mannosyltransferase
MKNSCPTLSLTPRLKSRRTGLLCLGVLGAGILLRFLYLDADPQYSEWVGFITDEGRWVRHGRSLALFGNLVDGRNLHLFLAPVFQLSNYFVFELVGVKILAARLLSAMCGSAILILFWVSLRQAIAPEALLLGLTLLAFQPDLVMLSRLAVPEMAVMFLQLAIYFMIISGEGSFWRLAAAGTLMALAVAVKLTMLLFLPIYFVIILAMPRNLAGGPGRWRDLRLFGMGLTTPLLVMAMVWFFFLEKTLTFGNIIEYLATATTFLGLSRPYNVISFPFEHSLSLTVNLWALGLWLSVLGWTAAYRVKIDFVSHRYLVTSAIWFTLYFLLMLTLEYFPSRYKIHILLPMVLFIAVGVSLLQRIGIGKVIEYFVGIKGPSELLWIGVFSFPTAALFSPLLVPAVALARIQPERLISKLSSLSLSLVAFMGILYQLKHNQQAFRCFLIFPLVGGIGWVLLATVSSYSFWPTVASPIHIAPWLLILLVASTISVCLASIPGWRGSTNGAGLVTGCALFYLTISLVRIAPGCLNPHYSIRDTSRDLGALLSGSHTIASIEADGLFNENDLPYESLTVPEFNLLGNKPEIVVVAFAYERVKNILEQEYYPIKTYDLYLSPAYDGKGRTPEGILVTVYKKNDASPK